MLDSFLPSFGHMAEMIRVHYMRCATEGLLVAVFQEEGDASALAKEHAPIFSEVAQEVPKGFFMGYFDKDLWRCEAYPSLILLLGDFTDPNADGNAKLFRLVLLIPRTDQGDKV